MEYAPILVFAFNRLDSLQETILSLQRNSEIIYSALYVFVDGARDNKQGEKEKVVDVQNYVKTISGFKSITYRFSEMNKGLGSSIISGVTEIINKYGSVIVLEDDLIVRPNFLSFMNQALTRYRDEQKVWSVCGYSNHVVKPKTYTMDSYFCVRSSSWGWATWKDRWMTVDWKLEDWERIQQQKSAFNKWGGSDCFKMLNDWHNGKNKSWAIRFTFSQFVHDKLSLFPIVSKISNEGFDGRGTNCKKWSRFKCDLDLSLNKDFVWPTIIEMNATLYKSAMMYNSLWIRAFSKIMYLIHR